MTSTKKGAVSAAQKSPKLRITSRIVNSKRHVKAYKVGGQLMSVRQTRALAAAGQVSGVRVVGSHVQAAIGSRPLSQLPTIIESN